MNIAYDFGLELFKIRKSQGLTQQEVADRLDLMQTKISAYEGGRTIPSVATADKVLRALGYKLEIVKA